MPFNTKNVSNIVLCWGVHKIVLKNIFTWPCRDALLCVTIKACLQPVFYVVLLHQWGALRNKGTVPPNSKANLCGDSHSTQAVALLSQPSNHGGFVLSTGRDHSELRGHWKDRQMVGWAHGGGPHICTSQSHQVPSASGLHRGMDRYPAPPGTSPGGNLDDVLRWVTHEDGGWGRLDIHLTPWRSCEVCDSNTFRDI